MAYEQQQVDLHAFVWVRFDGKVETAMKMYRTVAGGNHDGKQSFTRSVDVKCIWKSDCPVHSYNLGANYLQQGKLLRCCSRRSGQGSGKSARQAQECCFALAFS